jgi:hypothetical protein
MYGLQKDKTGYRVSEEWKNVEKLSRVPGKENQTKCDVTSGCGEIRCRDS